MKDFDLKDSAYRVEVYVNNAYNHQVLGEKKVFYTWKELQGWRFYLKAFWYRDWQSIKAHLRYVYLTKL